MIGAKWSAGKRVQRKYSIVAQAKEYCPTWCAHTRMLTLLVFVVITLGTLAFIIWLFRKADAPGDAGTKQKGDKVELHVAFIHPDLGIGIVKYQILPSS